MKLVVVAGTATEVGKTWVGARLAAAWRERGVKVAARKPVQSFVPGDGATDAEVLAAATGEDPHDVCPAHRWYPVAMAPPMAADVLGRPAFTVADLVGELVWPEAADVGLVEGVGGPRSPLAADGDTVTLAQTTAADQIVLVADAGLGTINAVRLSVEAFGTRPVVVVLNRFDAADNLHVRNRDWLAGVDGLCVVTDIDDLCQLVWGRIHS
jgi:dethiobiotin synthetase